MKYVLKKLWLPILILIISAVIVARRGYKSMIGSFWLSYLIFALYVICMGILCGFIGALIPRTFDPEKGIFRYRKFEENGNVYDQVFKIRKWKDKVFDLSQASTRIEKKNFQHGVNILEKTERLIQETCVAELTHWGIIILSPLLFVFCRNGWMLFFDFFYVLSNLMDIMIQRYNRPRLLKIQKRNKAHESDNSKL